MPYRHVVLFRVYDEVDDATLERAVLALDGLRTIPGIQDWTVRLSDDARKGRIIVENGLFETRAAFEAFRTHPDHAATSALLRELADWWIGDYEEDAADRRDA